MTKINNNVVKYVLAFFGVYLISAGASFAIFSSASGSSGIVSPVTQGGNDQGDNSSGNAVVFSGPKDQMCPFNGAYYTKEEKAIWEKRSPLLVMIENHEDSRPQSGLSRADIVYEAVAEGGITRFMGVYYCGASAPSTRKYDVGPVRSARTYFLDWASEYSDCPLYNHVGGANCSAANGGPCTTDSRVQALEQISRYGWLGDKRWCDMDYSALGYKQCRREPERTGESRATEHTVYCDTNELWIEAERRKANVWDESKYQSWLFKNDAEEAKKGDINKISLYFWKGYTAYEVGWNYKKESNTYERTNAGQSHIDYLTGKTLEAKVVAVQFTTETGPLDEHKHMLYKTVGKGDALVFQDGKAIEGEWRKKDRTGRTVFYDKQGKEIQFDRGLIWIEVLPIGNKVTYGAE